MKKLFFSGIVLALLLVFTGPVRAAEATRVQQLKEAKAQKVETVEARQAEKQAAREEKVQNRCDSVEQRITLRVSRHDNNTDRHQKRYERVQTWLKALLERLQANSTDTSELESEIAVFNDKIQQFDDDSAAYMASLRQTQDYACGQSEGAFKEQLGQARDLLEVVKEDSLDLRKYWQGTLRPLIRELVAANQ